MSLDSPIGVDDPATWMDLLESEEETPDQSCEAEALTQAMFEAIETCLDDREVFVLKAAFGIDRDCPVPLRTLGEQMGLSRERVRQIKNKAVSKLQTQLATIY